MLMLARTDRWLGGTSPTGYESEKVEQIVVDGKSKQMFRLMEWLSCRARSLAELNTKIHAVCASERFVLKFQLSAGNRHDAPEGRKLIESLGFKAGRHLPMDRAYKNDKTRALVLKQGLIPIVPPKKNRKTPWVYDTVLYKRRNKVERFFLHLKRFRRFFTRYDKLDIISPSVLALALIFDALFV